MIFAILFLFTTSFTGGLLGVLGAIFILRKFCGERLVIIRCKKVEHKTLIFEHKQQGEKNEQRT
jgi:hypothetical protein